MKTCPSALGRPRKFCAVHTKHAPVSASTCVWLLLPGRFSQFRYLNSFASSSNLLPPLYILHPILSISVGAQGRDGVIRCIGKSKEMVFMWPGRENLKILEVNSGHKMRLFRIRSDPQGGIVTIIDSTAALIIFAVTLHGTLALRLAVGHWSTRADLFPKRAINNARC
jgi:hypothetical protein